MTTGQGTSRNPRATETTDALTTGAGTAAMPPADEPDAIRADIATTRAALGDTVAALAAKADVKARGREALVAAKEQVMDSAQAATELAKDTAQVATERAKDAAERVGETVRRRPGWVVAGLATVVAVGGAIMAIRRRRPPKASRAARAKARIRRQWRAVRK